MCVGNGECGAVDMKGECYFPVLCILVVINHFYDLYLLQCLSKVINYTGSKTQGLGNIKQYNFLWSPETLLFFLRSPMPVGKMGRTFRPS